MAQGSGRVKLTKLNEVKNAIIQVAYFLNGPMFNLLFYCHIIERKWLLMKNLAITLPSKSKLSTNFSVPILLMKVSKYCRVSSRLKEIIQPPQPPIPSDKIFLRLWKKIYLEKYTEIYRHFAFKVLQESSSWASGNGACKCFFWHQTETCLQKSWDS